jgi:formate dehydrogenase major subunit
MGSNMAECHPVGFQWVMEARERGAPVLHIDPRFTRTSAMATRHVPIRAGSDIVFLGALVNHILTNGLDFRDYVVSYTNAAAIVSEEYAGPEDLDGLFSGFDPEAGAYDPASWRYESTTPPPSAGPAGRAPTGEAVDEGRRLSGRDAPPADPTLQHPRCVYQVLKRHYARYTAALVEELCGVPAEIFTEVANTICANSGRERTTAFVYSVGWTQHSVGAQYIRTAAIVQLLLGNIGRPGGGILALRGHAGIQGSTDIPTLYNILPGYLPMAHAASTPDLAAYLGAHRAQAGAWGRMDAYLVSLLRAWWGGEASPENDFCFDWLPRITGDHSTYRTTVDMADGRVEGFFVLGENPAVGSAAGRLQRRALAELQWLVVRDLAEVETATFWRDSPEIARGELRTADIATEVFLLPAAAHTEKDGSFTNTQRLLQWHHQAVEPPGDCRSDLWFAYHLGRIVREKLAASAEARDRPVLALTWDYPVHGRHAEPDAEAVLAEINGRAADGRPLTGPGELAADGSTACGCWIYSGCFAGGVNQTARRRPGQDQHWVAPDWGWAWPGNRRILYNRASADTQGRPWSERKRYVWWDEDAGRWTGVDVPDFPLAKEPGYRPGPDAVAEEALRGDEPFVNQPDGRGWLYAPVGLVDGPLPAHYEPHESPVTNPLYAQQANPVRQVHRRRGLTDNDGRHPFVLTTYRLTEHHTAGAMSRTLPYLAELQPELFCEVSPQLAAERGLTNGGWATIATARAEVEARVLVTDRLAPLLVQGRPLHQIGLPYHWGWSGLSTGDVANDLFGLALDPNVHIQEVKAATCDIRPGRRSRP